MMKKFFTAINCMDGRVQLPINNYIRSRFGDLYVDTITEAGPVSIIAENKDSQRMNSILQRVNISIDKHKSDKIAIVGHSDCAGNPVSDAEQIEQLKISKKYLLSLFPQIEVFALWVNKDFEVSEI